jgi:hypothetical protein
LHKTRDARREIKIQVALHNWKKGSMASKKKKKEMVFGLGEHIQKKPKKELSLLSLLNNPRRR